MHKKEALLIRCSVQDFPYHLIHGGPSGCLIWKFKYLNSVGLWALFSYVTHVTEFKSSASVVRFLLVNLKSKRNQIQFNKLTIGLPLVIITSVGLGISDVGVVDLNKALRRS
jgi:hypothetical protein